MVESSVVVAAVEVAFVEVAFGRLGAELFEVRKMDPCFRDGNAVAW